MFKVKPKEAKRKTEVSHVSPIWGQQDSVFRLKLQIKPLQPWLRWNDNQHLSRKVFIETRAGKASLSKHKVGKHEDGHLAAN